MKNFGKKLLSVILAVCCTVLITHTYAYANTAENFTSEEYLLETGMTEEQIEQIGSEELEFIVNDLSSANREFSYVEDYEIPQNSIQTLSGITFSAYAFKSGSVIYIYPTYEFTTDKRPRGKDGFSVQLGNAFETYEYGGKLWYKDYTMTSWASDTSSSLNANLQYTNGCAFTGAQLGSPDYSMKFKGCAYVHANVGSGTSKTCIMNYMYNPSAVPFSVGVSYGGAGISFSSSSTIYTAASTKILSY